MTVRLMSVELPVTERDPPEAAAWVAQYRAGDVAAFDQIVDWYEPQVRRFAMRLLASSQVDDVVQDVFLAALGQLKSFRGDSRLSTWLAGITLRQCRRRQRWHYRWAAMLQRRCEQREGAVGHAAADDASLEKERAAQVRMAVDVLPPLLREVVVLRYMQELGISEMAALLDVPRATVEVRLTRARAKLRESLVDFIAE